MADAGRQQRLLDALGNARAFPDSAGEVERIETHISCVYLVGEHAYKVKKALDLGFLDFSSLEERRRACGEELRLNRRLAPDVYLRVAPIAGSPDAPTLDGAGPPIEYAVVMRRFPQSALLSRMWASGMLETAHMDRLAALMADFHARIPAAAPGSGYGDTAAVRRRTLENLEGLHGLLPEADADLESLERWTRGELERLSGRIEQRLLEGRVRECHGDLHLDNLIEWRGRLMAFDGIEFNADLRWIDVINELAFVTMDLDDRGAERLSRHLRNAYLERTGDYGGLDLLRFYQVYRAMVRAKVNAIQAGQHAQTTEAQRLRRQAAAYVRLARRYTEPVRPLLLLTHGVSGTGKSLLSESLITERGYIRLRSDVERKRLYGLAPDADSAAAGKDIYTAQASRRTYRRLARLAEMMLRAGFPVIVDATFLRRSHRREFIDLADSLEARWHILSLTGRETTLRRRVRERAERGGDPSEADVGILEKQLSEIEPLSADESKHATVLDVERVPERWYERIPW